MEVIADLYEQGSIYFNFCVTFDIEIGEQVYHVL